MDTGLLSRGEPKVAEVCGSCFCCNFPGLINAMTTLAADANVLIAEPVGSCTDLSATIVQPLKEKYGDVTVAPLSVLVDPIRLEDILSGGTAELHKSAAYIYRKQIEEADILVINKSDLLSASELSELRSKAARAYPLAEVFTVSAQTGEGMEAWLDAVMSRIDAGSHLVEVDYDVYAEGEAVLGWLNATFRMQGDATDWKTLAQGFLSRLSKRFDSMSASVGHVKILIEADSDFVVGNLTGASTTLNIRGNSTISAHARMTLNARVEMSPEALGAIVREELAACVAGGIKATQLAWRCLSPGRPEPTYRFGHVVKVTSN